MDNRKVWAIVLLSIMFLSCSGGYTQYNIDFEYTLLYGLIDMTIVSVIMMLVPFILYKKNKGLLNYERGKKICIYNSVILLIIGIILMVTEITSQSFIGGLGALIFYFVNMAFFTYPKNYIEENIVEKAVIDTTKMSLSFKDETPTKAETGTWNIKGEDIKIEKEEEKNFCTNCGYEINKEWLFCNNCGLKLK